jgi:hypothetical protein
MLLLCAERFALALGGGYSGIIDREPRGMDAARSPKLPRLAGTDGPLPSVAVGVMLLSSLSAYLPIGPVLSPRAGRRFRDRCPADP